MAENKPTTQQLMDMKLHETVSFEATIRGKMEVFITRVPGGWIYMYAPRNGEITTTFVPELLPLEIIDAGTPPNVDHLRQ